MSGHLWNLFYRNDVEGFRALLSAAGPAGSKPAHRAKLGGSVGGGSAPFGGSPASLGPSPITTHKQKKGYAADVALTRQDVNRRDRCGRTLLHLIASSHDDAAVDFAIAILESPLTDIYVQDHESGWTALHRALYFGNVSIARMILHREAQDLLKNSATRPLVKIKDHEGNGPYDLLFLSLHASPSFDRGTRDDGDGPDDASSVDEPGDPSEPEMVVPSLDDLGDDVFTFGSNKNVTLGFGDEDDRQYPERVILRRPDPVIVKQYLESRDLDILPDDVDVTQIPFRVRSQPIRIRNVHMSKYHTAILTADPETNLYVCGHGKGGRLGVGDERTRYRFAPVTTGGLGSKEVARVALGHHHTLAVTSDGAVYSWGSNAHGQLGYQLSNVRPNEEPLQLVPRQIYGMLKRERIVGVAASRTHSVAFTPFSLFTFGKNDGQLGIVDSDARSLASQSSPRKVAASLFNTAITTVAAIERATICLLANHEVWVFANYGYRRLTFPLDGFSNSFIRGVHTIPSWEDTPNRIRQITGGGDTICALSSMGEVFTCVVSQPTDAPTSGTSTTNPSKIKGSFSQPKRIWSIKKGHMSARDVAVDQDGSIILVTEAGTVWRRVRRAQGKHSPSGDRSPTDFKFMRIPNLTRVVHVRASAFGAYAAIRREDDVTRTRISDAGSPVSDAYSRLMPFVELASDRLSGVQELLTSRNGIQSVALRCTADFPHRPVTVSTGAWSVPVHRFLLTGRSPVLRRSLHDAQDLDFLRVDGVDDGTIIRFDGLDPAVLFNLVYWLYTDDVVECWQFPKNAGGRNVRADLMRLAHQLELPGLESAIRQLDDRRRLGDDMDVAIRDPECFADADVVIDLEDGQRPAHSEVLCQRCPFFDGLFHGRAGGLWLQGRSASRSGRVTVDLTHFSSDTFDYVLRHIYSDAGEELFDEIVCPKAADFLDRVLDVMAIANELLLDRLSLVCQKVVGQYVHVRNVCELLNVIAPSAASAFRDAALDYICENLEVLLQNGYLDALDDNLLEDVDQRLREGQGYHARARKDDADLLQRWPELANRRAALRDAPIVFGDEIMSPSCSYEDRSPLARRRGKRPVTGDASPPSPSPRLSLPISSPEMMFDLDGEDLPTPSPSPAAPVVDRRRIPERTRNTPRATPSKAPGPWNSLDVSKLSMTEIMDQASASRVSNISLGIKSAKAGRTSSSTFGSKPSQKERKRAVQSAPPPKTAPSGSPWQLPPAPPTTGRPERNGGTPQLTMRQTVAKPTPRKASNVARTPEPERSAPSSWVTPPSAPPKGSEVYSVRHPRPSAPTAPSEGASMADILSQQQAEKDIIQELSMAKRSLQDIQAEQEFQEWWDQESRRVMEAERNKQREGGGRKNAPSRRRKAKHAGAPADR